MIFQDMRLLPHLAVIFALSGKLQQMLIEALLSKYHAGGDRVARVTAFMPSRDTLKIFQCRQELFLF